MVVMDSLLHHYYKTNTLLQQYIFCRSNASVTASLLPHYSLIMLWMTITSQSSHYFDFLTVVTDQLLLITASLLHTIKHYFHYYPLLPYFMVLECDGSDGSITASLPQSGYSSYYYIITTKPIHYCNITSIIAHCFPILQQ